MQTTNNAINLQLIKNECESLEICRPRQRLRGRPPHASRPDAKPELRQDDLGTGSGRQTWRKTHIHNRFERSQRHRSGFSPGSRRIVRSTRLFSTGSHPEGGHPLEIQFIFHRYGDNASSHRLSYRPKKISTPNRFLNGLSSGHRTSLARSDDHHPLCRRPGILLCDPYGTRHGVLRYAEPSRQYI